MANALVVRTQRYKKIGDKTSPLVYTLKRKPRDAKMYDLKRIAEEIEALGGMSAEDVLHVGKAIVRNIREKLADGNSVRLDDFGIFRTSFHCVATEQEKDCTVKNIDKVRVNFKVAGTLRLVNDSVATTKGARITLPTNWFLPTAAVLRAEQAAFRTMGKRKTRWDEKSDEQVFMNNLK